MSERVDRGLRVSEKAVRKAEESRAETVEEHDHMTEVDKVISDLRDEYRDTLRQGVLDSREDFDLLFSHSELNAGVVTEDQGIIYWADDFGLRYLRAGTSRRSLRFRSGRSGVECRRGGARRHCPRDASRPVALPPALRRRICRGVTTDRCPVGGRLIPRKTAPDRDGRESRMSTPRRVLAQRVRPNHARLSRESPCHRLP